MRTKIDIAREYFPHASTNENAVRNLRRAIRRCPDLDRALSKGSQNYWYSKTLTVRQVRLIYEYLGEP